MSKQTLSVVPRKFTIHRLNPNAAIPSEVFHSPLYFLGKTADELSIVARADIVVDSLNSDSDWRVMQVTGPLDLSLVGIMAHISNVLAIAQVSVFVVSTFETDFVLVKDNKLAVAITALNNAGYTVVDSTGA